MRRLRSALVACVVSAVGCGTATTPRAVSTPVARKPAPQGAALPGACVDPARDAIARLGVDADLEGLQMVSDVDLDADGTTDRFVTHANFCGTGGCNWQLYVWRAGCGHFVGELFGLMPTARDAASSGLVDLQITARNGCGGMARTETRVRFNGRSYVAAEVRDCRCPDPSEDVTEDTDPDKWCEPWRAVGDS